MQVLLILTQQRASNIVSIYTSDILVHSVASALCAVSAFSMGLTGCDFAWPHNTSDNRVCTHRQTLLSCTLYFRRTFFVFKKTFGKLEKQATLYATAP